jgi:hypothetical protein
MTIRLLGAALLAAGLFALPAAAQSPRPGKDAAPKAAKAPRAAKPQQPYAPVAVAEPKPFADGDLAPFRERIAAAAKRKDRAALGKLVAETDFFWVRENGESASKTKSGIDNLVHAANLKDDAGWQALGDIAEADTAVPFVERAGVVCAPGGPQFDGAAFDKVAQSTGTEMGDWAYPTADGVGVRESVKLDSPVVETLGMNLVRVMQGKGRPKDFFRVVAPSGKVGFVAADALRPLTADQLCYSKDGGAWKIVGYVGGE